MTRAPPVATRPPRLPCKCPPPFCLRLRRRVAPRGRGRAPAAAGAGRARVGFCAPLYATPPTLPRRIDLSLRRPAPPRR